MRHRIRAYYEPYHAALSQAIGRVEQRFGAVWHLNLHSMPNDAYERLGRQSEHPLADFVLGDRDGTTCEPEFIALIEKALRDLGYTVARNDPYKGVQLIAQIGQPALNRHSLQVEIRRRCTWTRPRASATQDSNCCAGICRRCWSRWRTMCACA